MKRAQNDPTADSEPHVFDQTNGLVDLGTDSAPADPEAQRNNARRLASMNAASMVYGKGGTH